MEFSNYKNYERFLGKTILAIDYGTKVTGLGIYTPGRDPYPLPFNRIVYKSDQQILEDLKEFIDDECVEVLVLGIPLHLDGNRSEMTEKVEAFGEQLKKSYSNLEVYYQDETLTTYEAQERMKNSPRYNFKVDVKKIDELAASIILEDFIKKD
ncbi:Holliday junction resolvase RuvX [Halobacteriovorax sp. GB3]|uniref:Holliday junction resolvase RuvX n=1 Tax=Halobacteriovorax sp. GB3 TaxID=2719615 RepID=UPI00235FC2E0|nr:Holliday junction resolvase RuvX [Halobacteriovorax sp. GB3]MDD0854050.1 Holliday junction resolvase RuvX [Halobacteriovorax sp. GB3]